MSSRKDQARLDVFKITEAVHRSKSRMDWVEENPVVRGRLVRLDWQAGNPVKGKRHSFGARQRSTNPKEPHGDAPVTPLG
ncbi:hypothetical protein VTK73DRAFT_5576 [Phialemonium thermophilum]|uniref:Uncharacterized protein n=1 Tax=Phialemonium thermophilum TaxID=223376 RepID=A0ABR3XX13_9PEZI